MGRGKPRKSRIVDEKGTIITKCQICREREIGSYSDGWEGDSSPRTCHICDRKICNFCDCGKCYYRGDNWEVVLCKFCWDMGESYRQLEEQMRDEFEEEIQRLYDEWKSDALEQLSQPNGIPK
jgi:hypothetical protein